jgi:hypothetical protein
MMLPPFCVYSVVGAHASHQRSQKSPVCVAITCLLHALPFFVSQGSSSAHPRFSSWGTVEILCCVPSHAGRFTSLHTPTTNWPSKVLARRETSSRGRGYYNSRLSSLAATLLCERETGVMNSLKAAFVWGNAGIAQLVEQLICNSKRGFCVAFQAFARRVFQS